MQRGKINKETICYKKRIRQGDIYYCSDNNNTVGSEQRLNRPCLIISANALNKKRSNCIIVPITSKDKKEMINHYEIYKEDYPFLSYSKNTILLENLTDISQERLDRKIGRLSEKNINEIVEKIIYNFKDCEKR